MFSYKKIKISRVVPESIPPSVHIDSPRPKTPTGFFRDGPQESDIINYLSPKEEAAFEKKAASYQDIHKQTRRRVAIVENEPMFIALRERFFPPRQMQYSPVGIDEFMRNASPATFK